MISTTPSGFEFVQLRLRTLMGLPRAAIDDSRWLELQSQPALALKLYGIRLPTFPPDDVQRRFTGDTGRSNLNEAFSFYKFARSTSSLAQRKDPKILDFGGGWGRVSRFFLRDTKPDRIWVADLLSEAIRWLRETGNPCNVVQNEPLPPIKGIPADFDLVYAFSVFSHLSERGLRSWLDYLLGLLAPGGQLVFTTRGSKFIDLIERQRQSGNALAQSLPQPDEMRARYASGALQFYPTGGGEELTSDFYGETLIPRSYFEKNYSAALVQFTEQVENVPQAVVVLEKRASRA